MVDHPRARARSRVVLVLVSILGLFAALAATQAPASAGSLPSPTSATVRAYTDPGISTSLAGAPAAALPTVLAAANTPFRVEVTLWSGTAPAAFPNDQPVTFSANRPGSLSLPSATIPAGQTTTTFTISYSQAATAVTVTAVAGKGNKALPAASTAPFPVDRVLRLLDGQAPSLTNGTAGSDGGQCAVIDPTHPMCGIVILPHGATGTVALSLGLCPANQPCAPGALVTQLVANLTRPADTNNPTPSNLYSPTDPATMVIVCDKSLCGQGGVTKFTALWTESATGDLAPVPACTTKGVIDPGLEFCTDYVSSQRDNAGDLLLHVLFLKDVRGAI